MNLFSSAMDHWSVQIQHPSHPSKGCWEPCCALCSYFPSSLISWLHSPFKTTPNKPISNLLSPQVCGFEICVVGSPRWAPSAQSVCESWEVRASQIPGRSRNNWGFDPSFVPNPLQGVKKAKNKPVKSWSLKNIHGYHLRFLWCLEDSLCSTRDAWMENASLWASDPELLLWSMEWKSHWKDKILNFWCVSYCKRKRGFVFVGNGVRQQRRHPWWNTCDERSCPKTTAALPVLPNSSWAPHLMEGEWFQRGIQRKRYLFFPLCTK